MYEELSRFIAEGPGKDELERSRTGILSGFLRGSERIGGFGGKSDILASARIYGGSPDAWKEELKHLHDANPEQIQRTAQTWLSDGVYVLEVVPRPTLGHTAPKVDRSRLPDVQHLPELKIPELEQHTLSNGLK